MSDARLLRQITRVIFVAQEKHNGSRRVNRSASLDARPHYFRRAVADHRRHFLKGRNRRMNIRVNRRLEMGARALEFSRAHPVDDPGYGTTVKQLEDQLAKAAQLVGEQERGTSEVHGATARKSTLSRTIRQSQLVHLAGVAQQAAKDMPELSSKFDVTGLPRRQLPFRTVARTLLDQAEQHKELLVKHGLVEDRGAEGRRTHIGARANLEAIGAEVVQIVRGLDGFNTYRFTNQPDLLASWISASNVFGPTVSVLPAGGRSGGPSSTDSAVAGGEVKPAA
jgi:hypothetical protein